VTAEQPHKPSEQVTDASIVPTLQFSVCLCIHKDDHFTEQFPGLLQLHLNDFEQIFTNQEPVLMTSKQCQSVNKKLIRR